MGLSKDHEKKNDAGGLYCFGDVDYTILPYYCIFWTNRLYTLHQHRRTLFITYRSCHHLDNKHTVFGKLVGGIDVLSAMEQAETNDKDKPLKDIKILAAQVFVDPFTEAEEQLKTEREAARRAANLHLPDPKDGGGIKAGPAGVSVRAADGTDTAKVVRSTGVGKYLSAGGEGVKKAADRSEEVPEKKRKTAKFDFSKW